MLCANCCRVTVPYLSSSYSGNFAATSAVVLPGFSFSRPAYIESYTSRYRSISFCVIFCAAALEAAYEVDEVAGRADGVDVDDHQVALADHLVRRPAAIGAGVSARGDDDVVNDFAAALEHELVHFGFDLALAHAGLQPFVLDLPHGGVADAGGHLQQFDFVAGLDHARRGHQPASASTMFSPAV